MRFFEEIARREEQNDDKIVLYPEGLFYKAYDRSAFACVSRISSFKPSKKRVKYCGREVASIGFPAAAIAKYFPSAPRPLSDGRVEITLAERIDAAACDAWKSALPLKERRPRGSSKAYLPTLGHGGKAGTLFVHPADLLPDTPALAAGTTGPKQPAQAMGGRGAVQQETLRNAAEGPATGQPDQPASYRSSAGAGLPTDVRFGSALPLGASAPEIPPPGQSGRWPGPADRRLSYGTAPEEESPVRTTWLGRLLRKLTRLRREPDLSALRTTCSSRETDCQGLPTDRQGAAPEMPGGDRPMPAWRTQPEMLRTGTTVPLPAPEMRTPMTGTQPSAEEMAALAAGMRPTTAEMPTPMTGTQPSAAEMAALVAGMRPATAEMPTPAPDSSEPTASGNGKPAPEVLPEHWNGPCAGTTPASRRPAVPPACGEAAPADRRTARGQARRETKEERVARLIREFRLEAATPVECLLFVADLKKEIDGYL